VIGLCPESLYQGIVPLHTTPFSIIYTFDKIMKLSSEIISPVRSNRLPLTRDVSQNDGLPTIRQSAINENKMAVVNLEAALSSWKSIQNHKVYQMSLNYRTALSHSMRISHSSVGYLPSSLMRHSLGQDT
jgi:hypothetical protein